MNINKDRLADTFTLLCETDSPSGKEGKIAAMLKGIFSDLGASEIIEDETAPQTGSDSGNLIIRFHGTRNKESIFLNCHMDTVQPGENVQVKRSGDTFTSQGDTVLGSDDKSGIAAIIEAIRYIRDNKLEHPPFEVLLTTCEEIGLLGAKALDPSLIQSKTGYSLDSTGFGLIITGAPAANYVNITVRGAAAHAGLHPEWGINAITLAAKALVKVPQGRINEQSTVNFGVINGGAACNIVPEEVTINAEVRSHSIDELNKLTEEIKDAFTRTIENWRDETGEAKGKPEVTFQVESAFPLMKINSGDPVAKRIERTAQSIGMNLEQKIAGGGSDANIFNGYGLPTAIVATGMTHVHSTDEQVSLEDMTNLTRLLLALITDNG